MSGGGSKVSRRQAEIGMVHGKCVITGKLVKGNAATGWVYVGKGNIVRIRFTATTGFAYVGFDEDESATWTPSATSDSTVEVDMADSYNVVLADKDYIRVTSAVSRLEVVQC